MGQYTKTYSRSFHPEETLVLTWDSGYKNICIYDNTRLIHSWDQPTGFLKGVQIEDERLGTIKIKFTDTRPLQLELKVRGKKYKPNRDGKQENDISGIISVFWAMAALTGVILLWFLGNLLVYDMNEVIQTIIIVLTLIVVIYLATAILLLKKHYWGYFIGTGYLILSTIYYTWNSLTFEGFWMVTVVCFFRFLLIIYLLMSVRKVLFAISSKTSKSDDTGLIDERF